MDLHGSPRVRRTLKVWHWAAGFLLHAVVNYNMSSCAPGDAESGAQISSQTPLCDAAARTPGSSVFALRKGPAASRRALREVNVISDSSTAFWLRIVRFYF